MSDQQTTDLIAALRTRAVRTKRNCGLVRVQPEQLLALIECAEVVRTDYLLLSNEQRMKALQALKVLEWSNS